MSGSKPTCRRTLPANPQTLAHQAAPRWHPRPAPTAPRPLHRRVQPSPPPQPPSPPHPRRRLRAAPQDQPPQHRRRPPPPRPPRPHRHHRRHIPPPRRPPPPHRHRPNPSGTPIIPLIDDLDTRVINTTTGELLRHLSLDPTRNYQSPKKMTKDQTPMGSGPCTCQHERTRTVIGWLAAPVSARRNSWMRRPQDGDRRPTWGPATRCRPGAAERRWARRREAKPPPSTLRVKSGPTTIVPPSRFREGPVHCDLPGVGARLPWARRPRSCRPPASRPTHPGRQGCSRARPLACRRMRHPVGGRNTSGPPSYRAVRRCGLDRGLLGIGNGCRATAPVPG
jgi:hypothetical protein